MTDREQVLAVVAGMEPDKTFPDIVDDLISIRDNGAIMGRLTVKGRDLVEILRLREKQPKTADEVRTLHTMERNYRERWQQEPTLDFK